MVLLQVLVEGPNPRGEDGIGTAFGRSRHNKLVFFDADGDALRGQLVTVRVLGITPAALAQTAENYRAIAVIDVIHTGWCCASMSAGHASASCCLLNAAELWTAGARGHGPCIHAIWYHAGCTGAADSGHRRRTAARAAACSSMRRGSMRSL